MSEQVAFEVELIDGLTSAAALMAASVEKLTSTLDSLKKSEDDVNKTTKETGKTAQSASKGIDVQTAALGGLGVVAGAAVVGVGALTALLYKSLSAWEEHSKATGITVSALGSVDQASAKAAKAFNGIFVEVGRAVEASGAFQVGYGLLEGVASEVSAALRENEDAIKAVSQELLGEFLDAAEGANNLMVEWRDELAIGLSGVLSLRHGVGVLTSGITVLSGTIQGVLFLALSGWARIAEGVLTIMAELASVLGLNEEAMRGMAQEAGKLADESMARVGKELGKVIDASDKFVDSSSRMAKSFLGDWPKLSNAIGGLGKKFDGLIGKSKKLASTQKGAATKERARLDIQEQVLATQIKINNAKLTGDTTAQEELETSLKMLQVRASLAGVENKRVKALTLQVAATEAALEAQARALSAQVTSNNDGLLSLELELVDAKRAKNAALLDELEFQKALEEIEAARFESAAAGDELANKRAEVSRRQLIASREEARAVEESAQITKVLDLEILGLKAAALEAAREMNGEEAESLRIQIQALELRKASVGVEGEVDLAILRGNVALENRTLQYERERDELIKTIELIESAGDRAASAFSGISEVVGFMSDDDKLLARIFENGAQSAAVFGAQLTALTKLNLDFKDAQEEVASAMSSGVGVASALSTAFVKDMKKRAAIEAAINAAAAVAAGAFAVSGYPGFAAAAVGHAAAAIKFGAIAGGAFGSGAKPETSKKASGERGGRDGTPDFEGERRRNAEAIAEALGSAQGGAGGTVINIDFGSSTQLQDSPQVAQQIVDALASELDRNRG